MITNYDDLKIITLQKSVLKNGLTFWELYIRSNGIYCQMVPFWDFLRQDTTISEWNLQGRVNEI